jgi:hypothetical protein
MNNPLIPILFLLPFIGAFFGTIFIITFIQHQKAKSLIKRLSSEKLNHTRIRFFQIRQYLLTAKGLFPVKAELYYNDSLILICPKRNSWFNSMFNLNLPVILTSDRERIGKLIEFHYIYKPDRIKLTKWKDLIIDYQNYSITIEFLSKLDKDRILILKDLSPSSD